MAAYFKAKDYGSRTQWEEGIIELQKAIKIQPNYTQAKELLGEYFYALKKYDDAITTLESCVNEKDFSARYIFLLSEIYLKMNNGDKAKLYAEKYLARKDKVPNAAAKTEQTVLNANFAINAKKEPVPFNPKNLGPNINTKYLEYFPYMTPDGKECMLMWTPLAAGSTVRIELSQDMGTSQGSLVECVFEGNQGAGSVPATVLSQLQTTQGQNHAVGILIGPGTETRLAPMGWDLNVISISVGRAGIATLIE
mgnify:CR=1 FL=1